MNYSYNPSNNKDDQVEISQRPPGGFPGGPPGGFPGRPPQGFPGGPPQGFPGGPPQGFPGGRPGFPGRPDFDEEPQEQLPPGLRGVRPPQGPPPNIPGGIPTPPSEEEMRSFRGGAPGSADRFWQSDPRGIRRCLFRFTYVWLRNGANFWFFPVYVSRQSVIGFRWRQRGWDYFSINFRRISFFRCF